MRDVGSTLTKLKQSSIFTEKEKLFIQTSLAPGFKTLALASVIIPDFVEQEFLLYRKGNFGKFDVIVLLTCVKFCLLTTSNFR